MFLYCGNDLYIYRYYVVTRNNHGNLIYCKGVILNANYWMVSRLSFVG